MYGFLALKIKAKGNLSKIRMWSLLGEVYT